MDNFRDSYFNVTWDLTKKHLRGTFWGKQYDTGRGFAVTVINGGQVVSPTTEVLRLKWEKPDNTTGYVNATIVNGKFVIENIDQMFTVHGSVRADFELSVAGEFVASITFYVNVEKAVAVDAVASSSEFTALQTAITTVDGLDAGISSLQTDFDAFSAMFASRMTSILDYREQVIGNDWSAAIQSAVDNAPSGSAIYIPGGVYDVSTPIIIDRSNISIQFSKDGAINVTTANTDAIHVSEYAENVEIIGGKLFGNAKSYKPNCIGIYVETAAKGIIIKNMVIDSFNMGVVLNLDNDNIIITENLFRNLIYNTDLQIGGYGILAQATTNMTIANNTFENVMRHHIYLSRNQANLDHVGKNIMITGNRFKGVSLAAYPTGYEFLVKIMGTPNTSVIGNQFDGGVGHILIQSEGTVDRHCNNLTISENLFTGVKKPTTGVSSSVVQLTGSDAGEIDGLIFTNNIIKDNDTKRTVILARLKNAVITGNVIRDNLGDYALTVELWGENVSIINNQILEETGRSIYFGFNLATEPEILSKNIIIKDNNVKGWYPIYLARVDNIEITGNYLESTITNETIIHCLDGYNIKGRISDNTFKGGKYALRVPTTTEMLWFYNNIFDGVTGNTINNVGGAYIVEPYRNAFGTGTVGNNKQLVHPMSPSTGTWKQGDVRWNTAPIAGSVIGSVCVQSGTPGVWKNFGAIDA